MNARRLPVETAPCPACGSGDGVPLVDAPAQLVDLDQTFRFVTCRACGLAYLADRVRPEAIAALYDADYPLHRGPALWGPFASFVERDQAALDAARVATVLEHRRLGGGDTVLDVGCGRPTFLAALARATGCRAIGVDAVEQAPVAGVEVFAAMPPEWPGAVVDAAPFSAVTLWHYIEHDPAPVETLAWLGEHMRPDGVAVVEAPDLEGSTARWMGRRWPGLHTPRHASVFTPATLEAVAGRAGWRVARHTRAGTLRPFVLVALGALDGAGFRFGRHPAAAVFPLWAAGMALTWPWWGRRSREGLGLQTVVLRSHG